MKKISNIKYQIAKIITILLFFIIFFSFGFLLKTEAQNSAPNCKNVKGPTMLFYGQTGRFTAELSSPGSSLDGEINYYDGTIHRISYQNLTPPSGVIIADWTPTAVGTYSVCCRAWNDGVAECRPAIEGTPGPPTYTCAGPDSCLTVTVSAPTPTSTPTPITPECAANFNVSCAGSTATISWTAPGNIPVSLYVVRLNHEPYDPLTGHWFNAAEGDQSLTTSTTSISTTVETGANYVYDIQGVTSDGLHGARCPYLEFNCSIPTAIPVPPTATPVPPTITPIPGCSCNPADTCTDNCVFDKFATPVTYIDPIKCNLSDSLFPTTPSDKNSWCQRSLRTKGDADGKDGITNTDYFYYVAAANGGKIPVTVNPDFNGDGEVGLADRTIVVKSLNP